MPPLTCDSERESDLPDKDAGTWRRQFLRLDGGKNVYQIYKGYSAICYKYEKYYLRLCDTS